MAGLLDWPTLLGADFTFRSVFGAGKAAEVGQGCKAAGVAEATSAPGVSRGWKATDSSISMTEHRQGRGVMRCSAHLCQLLSARFCRVVRYEKTKIKSDLLIFRFGRTRETPRNTTEPVKHHAMYEKRAHDPR